MKFRLQFWSSAALEVLAIHTMEDKNYLLRAIQSETDITKHNKENFEQCDYTEPMTKEEIVSFIKKNYEKRIGREPKNCIGIYLEDSKETISAKKIIAFDPREFDQ